MTGGRLSKSGLRTALLLLLSVSLLTVCSFSCQHADQPNLPVGARPGGPSQVGGPLEGPLREAGSRRSEYPLVMSILDPRMEPLVHASDHWRKTAGPDRVVIDQVYLVPDLPSFFEVIATWDERSFFPVLIDDPTWSLPFLRAFRPARVVRIQGRVGPGHGPGPERSAGLSGEGGLSEDSQALWGAAERAVARAWTSATVPDAELPPAGSVPRRLGPTPPGLVLSNPESPMLAGAVTLAAGRFQPLVRLDPVPASPGTGEVATRRPFRRFHDILSLTEARGLARLIEARAAAVASPHDRLGDACDFLTVAADWPYRYRDDAEVGGARGEHAMDDLIGRVLETDEGGLASSRTRWAFTGRLLGSPAASVHRAMCALFLQPDETLLWNTFTGGAVWSEYRMTEAAATLGRVWPGMAAPIQRSGAEADLSAWHQVIDPVSRFGWIMVNSSGGPRQFSISGGSGCPADLPRGRPAAVSIIHSFSAADPLDASTLAGRWLENGAFVYYGAMNEPFLLAFRPPRLVAELAAAGIPLSAVLRQGPNEPFGHPWCLVYLGDPLYRFHMSMTHARRNRIPPRAWGRAAPEDGRWVAQEITAVARLSPLDSPVDEPTRLQWCLTAAISTLCHAQGEENSHAPPDRTRRDPMGWQRTLTSMDRKMLDPRLRLVLDELVTDALLNAGETERLLDALQRIPPAECGPHLGQAIETLVMNRLAELAGSRSLPQALDLWDALIRRPWPSGSEFPAQFTHRLAVLVDRDPSRYREPYRQRLIRVAASLTANSAPSPLASLIKGELRRLETPSQASSVKQP